jgi:hypothetical protein
MGKSLEKGNSALRKPVDLVFSLLNIRIELPVANVAILV